MISGVPLPSPILSESMPITASKCLVIIPIVHRNHIPQFTDTEMSPLPHPLILCMYIYIYVQQVESSLFKGLITFHKSQPNSPP